MTKPARPYAALAAKRIFASEWLIKQRVVAFYREYKEQVAAYEKYRWKVWYQTASLISGRAETRQALKSQSAMSNCEDPRVQKATDTTTLAGMALRSCAGILTLKQ